MSLYTPMIPRLPFDALGQKTEAAGQYFKHDQTPEKATNALAVAARNPSMPLIPPRITSTVNTLLKNTENPSWYAVISPRETRGLAGPLSISQLKQMYKVHEIKDNTLVWREGETNWQQLVHHTFLRSQLIYLPVLPPRIGTYNAELELFDPIVEVKAEVAENMVPLSEISVTKSCYQCGNVATVNCADVGEQHPDLFKCRSEVGTNEYASEILPGFLWVGNASAVKHRSIVTLKFTLIVNCAKNMKNPQPQPPHFRCRICPLSEEPEEEFSDFEANEIMGMLERVYDWVEVERLSPEVVARGDLPKPRHRGSTDQYGLPIRTAKDKLAFKHQLEEGQSRPEPRVLIWSREGKQRACFVACAYLMKTYHISLDKAFNTIKRNRPECNIEAYYMNILQRWERKYILGILLCKDCAEEKQTQLEKEKEKLAKPTPELDNYEQCIHLLSNHLPKLIGDKTELALVGNPTEYIIKVKSNQFISSPWSGLLDLDLFDRRLSDRTLAFLFQLLSGTECLARLRSLKLRNNYFSLLASRALLLAYYPKASDPDEEFYLEEELQDREKDLSSLTLLDLSHNSTMDDLTVKYLSLFLKQCNSLITLNLFNCQIEDDLLAILVSCLIKETSVFHSHEYPSSAGHDHDEDSSVFSNMGELMCNESITDLNIGRNKIGTEGAAAITQMFKQNAVLHTLRMEYVTTIEPLDWKNICNAIRLYNSSLGHLVLNSNDLTVKTCEYIANITTSYSTLISKLTLPRCGLVGLHVQALQKHLTSARYLQVLDLSGNDLSVGVEALCQIIKGTVNVDDEHSPPLDYLDISSCQLNHQAVARIAQAMSTRLTWRYLDLSYNIIGPQNDEFLSHLSKCSIIDLRMNYCQLKTKFTGELFSVLAHRSKNHVCNPSYLQSITRGRLLESLRFLYLEGNEISDSISPKLLELMDKNISVEILDLGYNAMTNECAGFLATSTIVKSEDPVEKKVYPLHINMLGNKCDPYLLEAPGMARSKVNFFFGTHPNKDNENGGGYTHIENRVRGKFVVQKQLDELYRKTFPAGEISNIV